MTTSSDTPLTDAAALGFARILVSTGTPDNPKFETTEIIPSDFARTLELECARLLKLIDEADHTRYCAFRPVMNDVVNERPSKCNCFKSRALAGGWK